MTDGVKRVDVDAIRARCEAALRQPRKVVKWGGALVDATPSLNIIEPQALLALLDALAAAEQRVAALEAALREALQEWQRSNAYALSDDPWPRAADHSKAARRFRALVALGEAAPATREE